MLLQFPAVRATIYHIVHRGGAKMEVYYYKCPVCGFIYQVPAYWVSYSPEQMTEFPHLSMLDGKLCANVQLELQPEE